MVGRVTFFRVGVAVPRGECEECLTALTAGMALVSTVCRLKAAVRAVGLEIGVVGVEDRRARDRVATRAAIVCDFTQVPFWRRWWIEEMERGEESSFLRASDKGLRFSSN